MKFGQLNQILEADVNFNIKATKHSFSNKLLDQNGGG